MILSEEQRNELIGRILSILSRKFLLAMLIFFVSSFMVFEGKLSAEVWLQVVAVDIFGYDFANAYSKKHKEGK